MSPAFYILCFVWQVGSPMHQNFIMIAGLPRPEEAKSICTRGPETSVHRELHYFLHSNSVHRSDTLRVGVSIYSSQLPNRMAVVDW
jgi:hypothetical protein